jgi:hypothetical protein
MDAYAAWLDCHDGASGELLTVARQRFYRDESLLLRSESHEANDSTVRLAAHDRDFAEILVEGNQHLVVLVRVREDLRITRISRPTCCALDVVSAGSQHLVRAAPDADVEQDLHGSAIRQRRFDSLVTVDASGIQQARANVLGLQPCVALQNRVGCVARG